MSEKPTTATAKGEEIAAGSLVGDAQGLIELAPRQLSDELSLAKRELKTKGISVGVAAALFGVVLVVLGLFVIALVVAAIMGLATVMPPWLAALIVAAFFAILIAIGVLVGIRFFKAALPLKPEEAMRGLQHDLGVLREGASFDPASLDKPAAPKEDNDAESEPEGESGAAKEKPAPPSDEELRERIQARREHIGRLRDDLLERGNVAKRAKDFFDDPQSLAGQARQRWVPLGVVAASGAAFVILLRKLMKK